MLARTEGHHPPDHFVARDDREVHLADAPGAECTVPDVKVSAAHGRRLDLHHKGTMLQLRHGQLTKLDRLVELHDHCRHAAFRERFLICHGPVSFQTGHAR